MYKTIFIPRYGSFATEDQPSFVTDANSACSSSLIILSLAKIAISFKYLFVIVCRPGNLYLLSNLFISLINED